MMAMCFKATGNLDVIRDWTLNLSEPYDRNNGGESEADNLGQALYLVSLVSDRSHPLVARILRELPRFEVGGPEGKYLKGRSDFAEHPVYQTRWAKLGLGSLGLPDPYIVPRVNDTYAATFLDGRQGRVRRDPGCGRPREVSVSGLGLRPFPRAQAGPHQRPRLSPDVGAGCQPGELPGDQDPLQRLCERASRRAPHLARGRGLPVPSRDESGSCGGRPRHRPRGDGRPADSPGAAVRRPIRQLERAGLAPVVLASLGAASIRSQ